MIILFSFFLFVVAVCVFDRVYSNYYTYEKEKFITKRRKREKPKLLINLYVCVCLSMCAFSSLN